MLDLSTLEWKLCGMRPFQWKVYSKKWGAIAPMKAHVPGTVQNTLLQNGQIDDWRYGMNSRLCEWVEHRHWDFSTAVPAGSFRAGERVFLHAELDYWGWVLVDGKDVARFEGALAPHVIELTGHLTDGAAHELSIVFQEEIGRAHV
jgi:hypothetical protein